MEYYDTARAKIIIYRELPGELFSMNSFGTSEDK